MRRQWFTSSFGNPLANRACRDARRRVDVGPHFHRLATAVAEGALFFCVGLAYAMRTLYIGVHQLTDG